MSSAGWLYPARHLALLGVAALLAGGAARAQVAISSNDSAAPAAESQPSEVALYSSSTAEPDAPEPASPAAAAAGQYDNSAHTGGGHGWKSKLAIEAGGGFNMPSGDTGQSLNTGFNFTFGAGQRLNKMITMLVEYQFIDDGLTSAIINQAGSTGGNAHIWSFTVDPVVNLIPKGNNTVYVTGGGGFYRKVTNFTVETPQQFCSYFYCGVGYAPQTVGHFSSNQGGWNLGGGVSHRFAGMYGDGRMSIFAEARYLDVLSPAVNHSPNGLGTTTVAAGTKLIPVTFGFRF